MNAWLIEKPAVGHPGCTTGLCLGVTDLGKIRGIDWRAEWTIPDLALRFARKEDAEAAAKVLLPTTETLAIEHSWS